MSVPLIRKVETTSTLPPTKVIFRGTGNHRAAHCTEARARESCRPLKAHPRVNRYTNLALRSQGRDPKLPIHMQAQLPCISHLHARRPPATLSNVAPLNVLQMTLDQGTEGGSKDINDPDCREFMSPYWWCPTAVGRVERESEQAYQHASLFRLDRVPTSRELNANIEQSRTPNNRWEGNLCTRITEEQETSGHQLQRCMHA